MKSLPPSERPYEKCQKSGPAVLSDAELLAVILRTGTREKTSVGVAASLLEAYGSRAGLSCVMTLSRRELEKIPGIGPVKAVELLAVAELCRRITRSRNRPGVSLRDPSSIAAYFMEDMCYLPQEEMRVAMFDTRNRLLHEKTLSMGTVNASLASPRELFLEALRYGAVYLVLLHNHPSGDPTPSEADIRMTDRMAQAGDLLHIPLMDHIIIGDHSYTSMREEGLLTNGRREVL
ncbi:MAG: DNA repair protein RadC [Lachnospiraceae bacterium]|nr:DNA repair protein RadC [Lachnospiraceae bacterium]